MIHNHLDLELSLLKQIKLQAVFCDLGAVSVKNFAIASSIFH